MEIITGALLAGAAATATNEVAKVVFRDIYEALKSKLRQWFADKEKPEGEMALANIEKSPDIWKGPLEEAVIESEADKNETIIQAAQALINTMRKTPEGNQVLAKYQVNLTNSTVGIIGDKNHVQGGINFGTKK